MKKAENCTFYDKNTFLKWFSGTMKYIGGMVEFYDRLVFITATKRDETPHTSRTEKKPCKHDNNLTLTMPVSNDLEPYIRQKHMLDQKRGLKGS